MYFQWKTETDLNKFLDQLEAKRKKEGESYEKLLAKIKHQLMLRHVKDARDDQIKR